MFVIHAVSNTGGNNYFEIIGNQTGAFAVGGYFQVRNSVTNSGLYKISAVTLASGYTRLAAVAPIPTTATDGVLNGGVYIIDFADATLPGKTPVVIPPATYNTTATSITLPARGAFDYGERLVENAVHVLENFAGVTAPVNPTIGQHWYDYPNRTMRTYTDGAWSADVNVTSGTLTFNDAQNGNSKVVITASEPAGKTATGITIYPVADVASGQPIFRVLNSAGAVHLAVLRTDSVVTDTRFVSTGSGVNDFSGTVSIGDPAKAFSSGSVLNVDGHADVFGKVILDEAAASHGLHYRSSGSFINTASSLWTIQSAHTDSASFRNATQQVALLGTINKFFTPVELSGTLKVTGNTTMSDATVTGTLTVDVISSQVITTASLTVTGAMTVTSAGTTLQKQLNANNQVVTGIATPTADTHAANKKYVDDNNFLSKLTDVAISGPADKQVLTYNAATSKWNATTVAVNDGLAKDEAAQSIIAGTHVGITPTYNSTTKALSLVVHNQTFSTTGDATGTATLNWSGEVSIPLTLKASGVTAGSYAKVTVNSKGLVTVGGTLAATDIPTLAPSKIVGTYDLANTYKVTNAIDPTADGDYVTLRYLQSYTFDAGTF